MSPILDQRINGLSSEVAPELRYGLQGALRTLRVAEHPVAVLANMSRLCLQLLTEVYQAAGSKRPSDNLYDCIVKISQGDEKTKGLGILPDEKATYLQTIRILSNKSDHAGERSELTAYDAETALSSFLIVLRWFYVEYATGPRLASLFNDGSLDLAIVPNSKSPLTDAPFSADEVPVIEKQSRVFISYKRGVSPDEPVAMAVFKALSEHHELFIDQTMLVGTRWAEQIEAKLKQSDFLITFLTESSVNSEMVKGELEMAYRLGQQQGYPAILPVRLAYLAPFTYPLSTYLNSINWAVWERPEDTPRLIQELLRAIAGQSLTIDTEQRKQELLQPAAVSSLPRPLPQAQPPQAKSIRPAELEMPEGTMNPESQFYVQREVDGIALNAIQRQGVTITIKGPRQMGKSSLLIQVADAALKANKRVAFLDFQFLDHEALTTTESFLHQFCRWVTEQLELPDRVEEYWRSKAGHSQCCTRYMQTYVLKELGSPLLLAMDEVDRIFDTEFQSDFFGMLRGWHNSRALPTTRIWRNLDLALVTATEPYHLIENLNQSPFNVGEVITLTDFTLNQVLDLNERHGEPFNPEQLQQLMAWVNGHPYLVRRALYLVASQQCTVETLFVQASAERGPFGDHLRYHLFRISNRPQLVEGLKQVVENQDCEDDRVLRLLSAAGLIYREGPRTFPRCRLYTEFFREQLHG